MRRWRTVCARDPNAGQVLKVGTEICEGLEKAHRSGVVHRDLKPSNIKLTKSGAKLMDFGLAKAVVTAVAAVVRLHIRWTRCRVR